MPTKFTPNPVLIEAAKYARDYIASAYPNYPERAWICDAIDELRSAQEFGQARALADAVDSVLGNEWGFLSAALYAKNIGPFTGARKSPQGEERRTLRLWWLRQIIEGNPVPGAEV